MIFDLLDQEIKATERLVNSLDERDENHGIQVRKLATLRIARKLVKIDWDAYQYEMKCWLEEQDDR
jgi:hypothetical protein